MSQPPHTRGCQNPQAPSILSLAPHLAHDGTREAPEPGARLALQRGSCVPSWAMTSEDLLLCLQYGETQVYEVSISQFWHRYVHALESPCSGSVQRILPWPKASRHNVPGKKRLAGEFHFNGGLGRSGYVRWKAKSTLSTSITEILTVLVVGNLCAEVPARSCVACSTTANPPKALSAPEYLHVRK